MVKAKLVLIFLVFNFSTFGQNPSLELGITDSIFITVNGRGAFSDLNVILFENMIYVHKRMIDDTKVKDMLQNESAFVNTNDLYRQIDVALSNDSLYRDLREKTFYWSLNNNVSDTKKANEFTESRVVWMCLEIWQSDLGYKKILIQRCYYRILENVEYVWLPDFLDFYWQLYRLHKRVD